MIVAQLKGRLAALSSTRQGFLAIVAGTATGQVVAVIASPVISRLFSPADFGVFSVISALALTLSTVTSLRFELAVPLPKDDSTASALVALGLLSAIVTSVVGITGLWIFGDDLAGWLAATEWGRWLWFVPLIASTVAVYQVFNALAIRQGRFPAIARRNIVQATITVVIQVSAGLLGYRVGGLVTGLVVGQAVGAVSLMLGASLSKETTRKDWTIGAVGAALKRYRRFPLLLAPAGFLNSLGLQAPLLLIAYWYGSTAAGWLGLTQRVLSLPVALIGQAIAQVYLSEIAKSRREGTGQESRLFWNVSKRLFLVGVGIAIPLLLFAPFAFQFVFGGQWVTSGRMAQALAVALAFQIVASPLSQTLIVFERNKTQLLWDASRLVAVATAVAMCALVDATAITATWAVAGVSVFLYGISWSLSRRALAPSKTS